MLAGCFISIVFPMLLQADADPGAAYPNEQTGRLELYIGVWNARETHFDDRGETVATANATEEITWILDQHAIRRTYTRRGGDHVYRAEAVLTWNDVIERYQGYWINNLTVHGPILVRGEWNDSTRTMEFALESSSPDGGTDRYRVVEQFADEDSRVATTYLVRGDELVKRLEIRFKRATPCPGRIRVIFDQPIAPPEGE